MWQFIRTWIVSILVVAGGYTAQANIIVGNIDDFQSGTTEGWGNPWSTVLNVGPGGAGDHSLQIASTGGFGSGSRFLAFTSGSDWTGDYLAAGVTAIEAEFNNAATIGIRLALNGPGGWWTTAPIAVNTGGSWGAPVSFATTAAGLTYVGGGGNDLNATLAAVSQIQLYSAASPALGGPSGRPRGDSIAATTLVDNITAVPEPTSIALLFLGMTAAFASARRRRSG